MDSLKPFATLTLVAAVGAFIATPAPAQTVTTPQASPPASIRQTFGITEVAIDYHRPRVNGRQVWGALVPWDSVWRAGANENTVIRFSHPVRIEGKDLAAGTYGLHTIPGRDLWTIAFSTNSTSWGSFSYDEKEDALRVSVEPRPAPFAEWLAYGFEELGTNGMTAYLHWEELKVPFRIEADTAELVVANARNELRSLPGFQWQGWWSAANYAFRNGIHLEEALQWTERSLQIQENGNNLGLKAALLLRLERAEEVEAVVARVLEVGAESDLNQLGYALLGAGATERAIGVFEENVRRYPESWNCYDSLAEAQAAVGRTPEAVRHYTRAREMAPEAQHGRIDAILQRLEG